MLHSLARGLEEHSMVRSKFGFMLSLDEEDHSYITQPPSDYDDNHDHNDNKEDNDDEERRIRWSARWSSEIL